MQYGYQAAIAHGGPRYSARNIYDFRIYDSWIWYVNGTGD